MSEGLDVEVVEHAPAEPTAAAPVLVVLPDPEVQVDPSTPVLGEPGLHRLSRAALAAGFAEVQVTPGTRAPPADAREVGTHDEVGAPALVVFESSLVHPDLLALMVEHPLEHDERFTLYDDAGRPAASFTGQLVLVPATMPVSEELDWPEDLGPTDVARVVYPADRRRAEDLVLRSEQAFEPAASPWNMHVALPTLRVLTGTRRPLAQLELGALLLGTAAGALALSGSHAGLVLAGVVLLLGVHISRLLRVVRRLREGESSRSSGRLASATRPLAHAAATSGMTYAIVSQTGRTSVAGLILLALGTGAVVLSLVRARRLLRGTPADAFALPDAAEFSRRMGVVLPRWLLGVPALELAVLVVALPGFVELPWAFLAAGGVARLWRWYAGPPQ